MDPPWINISIMRLIQVTMRHLDFSKVETFENV